MSRRGRAYRPRSSPSRCAGPRGPARPPASTSSPWPRRSGTGRTPGRGCSAAAAPACSGCSSACSTRSMPTGRSPYAAAEPADQLALSAVRRAAANSGPARHCWPIDQPQILLARRPRRAAWPAWPPSCRSSASPGGCRRPRPVSRWCGPRTMTEPAWPWTTGSPSATARSSTSTWPGPRRADRRRGYRTAMRRHGLSARVVPGGLSSGYRAAAAGAWLISESWLYRPCWPATTSAPPARWGCIPPRRGVAVPGQISVAWFYARPPRPAGLHQPDQRWPGHPPAWPTWPNGSAPGPADG